MLAFFRSWNPEGLLQLCSKLILLSPAPIQTNIKSGDQNLLSIRSQNPEKYPWSTKHPTIEKTQISKINKTPTTHRRKKQHCLCRLHKYSEEESVLKIERVTSPGISHPSTLLMVATSSLGFVRRLSLRLGANSVRSTTNTVPFRNTLSSTWSIFFK